VAADGDIPRAGPGDDALRVTASVIIPAHELSWSFGPSGGPGGQHANRAHTRAEVRFDVRTSTALSDTQRARLRSRLGDVVSVSADDERSQLRNRRLALDRLRRRLAEALRVDPPRRPTRPTKGAVERRLEAKRHQAARKRERRRPHDD
jgi:ribosome-associated protein